MLMVMRAGVAAGLLLLLPICEVGAQPNPEPLAIELNKVEAGEDVCRINFVVTNRTESRFDELRADLVLFDHDGVIADRLTFDLGPMRAKKTQVVSFPIKSVDCGKLGHVLLNEMAACSPPPGESFDCTRAVAISSRGPVAFVK